MPRLKIRDGIASKTVSAVWKRDHSKFTCCRCLFPTSFAFISVCKYQSQTTIHRICPSTKFNYLFVSVRIVINIGLISFGKKSSIFNKESFTPCLWICIIGIWARNSNEQFSKSSIGSASARWQNQIKWCLTLWRQINQIFRIQAFIYISVGCCICFEQ